MSDSVFSVDPKRIFFTVDRDKEWKKVTAESFICSTTDDLVNDDPYIYLEPEKLSIRNLMKEWLKETDHRRNCDMCETALCALKKTLKPVYQKRKVSYYNYDYTNC